MIPRRIIHVYSAPPGQPEELPLFCQAAVTSARLLHPDFEHVLYGREEMTALLHSEYPEYVSVFDCFPLPIQRFDFFRYLAIHAFGGFYLDLDVFLAKSLEPLTAYSCVFPFEELTMYDYMRSAHRMDWDLANYAFGAEAGHPFIEAVIENCVRSLSDRAWSGLMMQNIPEFCRSQYTAPATTGPGVVSRTLAERADLAASVTVLFPHDVRRQSDWHCFGDFGVHLQRASWRPKDGWIRARLLRFWEKRQFARVVRAAEHLGPERSGPWQRHFPGSVSQPVP